jgi:glycosyltransferase involved in cell wall biosynthesis
MDERMKMTIITPVWNLFEEGRIETFRQTMESVHNQTYKNIEHIVINNNSTDDTQKLIDEYIEKGWCTCHFQPVQGLWHAMQKGYEVATGDFINFMNSDDFFSTDKAVEIAANALVEQEADWFFSDATRIGNGEGQGYWKGVLNNIFFGNCPCHQTVFVSMDTMREFGGFDFNYKLSLDNHMMLKLLVKNKKHAYVAKSLVNFRNGGWSSEQKIAEFRKDYAINFHDQIGKSFGMTLEECHDIWCYHVLHEKNDEKYIRKLGKKIQNKQWQKQFYRVSKDYFNNFKTKYYLFGFIPMLTIKKTPDNTKIKYYLFGILPILKTKTFF